MNVGQTPVKRKTDKNFVIRMVDRVLWIFTDASRRKFGPFLGSFRQYSSLIFHCKQKRLATKETKVFVAVSRMPFACEPA